ncbi:acyl-CoA desaturase [Paraliomyxa miuraensis]|uniref:acyl-CoA desaturase n=1 Tax=Paraliomyxa miuraensis TaxID=376150 RepID=UPI002253868F|nr:acyl-CoA desaturase [Paraliomyxa miuraensis]MCX4246413.1 acyl-CoA desaturase [Paraliomyxa miuraensis]
MRLLEIPPAPPVRGSGRHARTWRDYDWAGCTPFLLVHVFGIAGAVAGLVMGAPASAWICALVLYVVRMFGVTGGYHRYFSHRTFKTGRVMQFLLAFLAMSSAQRGVLWWAAHHRDHHKYSDGERDVHSPVRWGFWHSHVGWVYDRNDEVDWSRVKDLARYPELVVLEKLWLLPPMVMAAACFFTLGWWGLLIGFLFSTVVLWHGTFTINSLAHVWGKRRYATTDDSRNNWLLALITLGEGWHNNHHHHMSSCRQGFFWWEVDLAYYALRALAAVGLVWEIREPSPRVYEQGPAKQPDADLLPSQQRAA